MLADAGVADVTVPITYMNSTAAIKAFTGRHGGTVCTSSNAGRALGWAFEQGEKVLFLPDQHLGRNTAVRSLGLSLDDCVLFDPHKPGGGSTPTSYGRADDPVAGALLGARAVHPAERRRHARPGPGHDRARAPRVPVRRRRRRRTWSGRRSTSSRRSTRPAGSSWAIGTELNLVRRLARAHPDKQIVYLDSTVCYCSTMNRIDLPHLVWTMEHLAVGRVVNRIAVDAEDAHWARVALDQMLALPGGPSLTARD